MVVRTDPIAEKATEEKVVADKETCSDLVNDTVTVASGSCSDCAEK